MEVREGKDRRVGFDPEKLLTLEEAARRLGIPADDVEAAIREGRLAAFRLAGDLLRIRLGDLERFGRSRAPSSPARAASSRTAASRGSLRDRVADFFYFNDFYLLALLILIALLAIIFTL